MVKLPCDVLTGIEVVHTNIFRGSLRERMSGVQDGHVGEPREGWFWKWREDNIFMNMPINFSRLLR